MGFADELMSIAHERSLDDHPFMVGLREKTFTRESFAIYLRGVYPLVAGFPRDLALLLAECPHPAVRCHLLANFMEEDGIVKEADGSLRHVPARSHLGLYSRVMKAMDLDTPEPGGKREMWFDRELARGNWIGPAAQVMVGGEGNVPPTYRVLLPYLIEHCGFSEEEAIFFHEHIEADQDHAAIGAALIEQAATTDAERAQARAGVRRGTRTWWAIHERWAREMARAAQAVPA